MALLKYLLPYAIAAVALMYFQSNGVFAAKQCIMCSNVIKPDNLTKNSKYCDVDSFKEGDNTHYYCKSTKDICGGFSYKLKDVTTVVRGCDLNCTEIAENKTFSNIVCRTCSEDKCNTFDLSSSTQIGYSIVPLVFSIVLAMYSN